MGQINVVLTIGNVSESQVAAIKTALDTQIADWTTTYPAFTFARGLIQWNE